MCILAGYARDACAMQRAAHRRAESLGEAPKVSTITIFSVNKYAHQIFNLVCMSLESVVKEDQLLKRNHYYLMKTPNVLTQALLTYLS